MFPTPVKTFIHPHNAYRLEYPSHWDQITKEDGRSCGFGPHERDNVGLWISVMPMSLDTDEFIDDLPKLMETGMPKLDATELKRDTTLKHYGLKADIRKEGQCGNYWLVAGGDLILFASTQVPTGEGDEWNPLFCKVMASLKITREDELFYRKVANEVLEQLKKLQPEQEFEFDEKGIRGKNQIVYLNSLYREVKESPKRRAAIIQHFVENLSKTPEMNMGQESWEEVQEHILPVLKHKDYITEEGPTQHLYTTEWLADVLICYVIRRPKMFRFVTGWDVNRWGTDGKALHELAMKNTAKLPWPREMAGARQPDGGRVIVLDTNDSMTASRLLHPDLHHMFSQALGSPFLAGIPDRGTLVLFSDRRSLKKRILRRLKKDHDTSAYSITPRAFLVTRDGIAVGPQA